ncbi:LacI family DNA-binding transcriptional regulator [Pseudonocardia sp. MH-G8]|uniref:LacI family DNA-binding transcriptional regulator n=1 Tax=Pseudonocardia sp. MH-G8 TaxID=1854588 RepID=UPI0018E953AA|nr:LacI family DNA-binding transcriptional regulator [Pseudonocardia sp. MH-G8]
MKRTTIGAVAAAAGVSSATVSRVLNGGPVNEATAARVREAVDRLQYTPNALTKSIFAGRSQTIGVVIDDLRSPFYLDLMRGIDEVADANGSLVMFANTFRHDGREAMQIQSMDEQRVRGLIVTSAASADDRTYRMAAGGTPCVVVARTVQDPPPRLHSVALDNIAAGRLMAEHLVSCGRRSVGVITSGPRPSQLGRTEGLRRGLAEAGLALTADDIVTVDGDDGAEDAVATLLQRRPDAVACVAGRRTVAIHAALLSQGVTIPDDIGFITMDDFAWASALGISVVAQPAHLMGQRAAEFVVENPAQPRTVVFEPTLVARTSCGEATDDGAASR